MGKVTIAEDYALVARKKASGFITLLTELDPLALFHCFWELSDTAHDSVEVQQKRDTIAALIDELNWEYLTRTDAAEAVGAQQREIYEEKLRRQNANG